MEQTSKVRAPEDAIPDKPENRSAREFLKSAPSKGLWLPMGMEVKVMQCWRCKAYGHRTGDRECPLSNAGNVVLDAERQAREDPMARYTAAEIDAPMSKREKKQAKRAQLEKLLIEIRKEAKAKKKKHKKKRSKRQDTSSSDSDSSCCEFSDASSSRSRHRRHHSHRCESTQSKVHRSQRSRTRSRSHSRSPWRSRKRSRSRSRSRKEHTIAN